MQVANCYRVVIAMYVLCLTDEKDGLLLWLTACQIHERGDVRLRALATGPTKTLV